MNPLMNIWFMYICIYRYIVYIYVQIVHMFFCAFPYLAGCRVFLSCSSTEHQHIHTHSYFLKYLLIFFHTYKRTFLYILMSILAYLSLVARAECVTRRVRCLLVLLLFLCVCLICSQKV